MIKKKLIFSVSAKNRCLPFRGRGTSGGSENSGHIRNNFFYAFPQCASFFNYGVHSGPWELKTQNINQRDITKKSSGLQTRNFHNFYFHTLFILFSSVLQMYIFKKKTMYFYFLMMEICRNDTKKVQKCMNNEWK